MYIDGEGQFKVPEVEMTEDELAKFVNEQKFIKAEIGQDIDEVEVNENLDNHILEDICETTFVPNIKDDVILQDDALKDFLTNN